VYSLLKRGRKENKFSYIFQDFVRTNKKWSGIEELNSYQLHNYCGLNSCLPEIFGALYMNLKEM
jgi:hypothetical protein